MTEYDWMLQVLARHELVTGQPTDNDGNCSAAPCPGLSDCLVITDGAALTSAKHTFRLSNPNGEWHGN